MSAVFAKSDVGTYAEKQKTITMKYNTVLSQIGFLPFSLTTQENSLTILKIYSGTIVLRNSKKILKKKHSAGFG